MLIHEVPFVSNEIAVYKNLTFAYVGEVNLY